jgi:hypothetical protein
VTSYAGTRIAIPANRRDVQRFLKSVAFADA